MTSRSRLPSVGMAVVLVWFILAVALPVWAQDATIGIEVAVEPESPYLMASADFTIAVEASGGAVSDVAVQVQNDCDTASGPIEVAGNGDDILEPGEQWEYSCHSDHVLLGALYVTVTGVDGVGGDVSASLMLFYEAPMPFAVEIATSTPDVYEGAEVTWNVLVGNDGPYSIVDVDGWARLNESGPYSSMTGPVETSGNGDDILDPGELWEYHWSAVLWQDSFVSIDVSGAHEDAPGGGFRSHTVSDVVIVTPESPPPASTTTVAATTTENTLPRTGPNEPLKRVGTLGMALLLFGVATLAGAAVLGKHRRQ